MTKQNWQPTFQPKDVELLEQKDLFSGFLVVKAVRFRFRLFGGGWSVPVTRQILCKRHAAAVLLYDQQTDQVILIEQLRISVLLEEGSSNPWMLEPVAGLIEIGEDAETTAYREAQEEAGCTLLSLIPICTYWVSVGISTEKMSVYCGLVNAPEASGVYGVPTENEDIRTHILSAEHAFELLNEGVISNVSGIVALQWLQLNRAKLRSLEGSLLTQ